MYLIIKGFGLEERVWTTIVTIRMDTTAWFRSASLVPRLFQHCAYLHIHRNIDSAKTYVHSAMRHC
jgi:hypothetical protein